MTTQKENVDYKYRTEGLFFINQKSLIFTETFFDLLKLKVNIYFGTTQNNNMNT